MRRGEAHVLSIERDGTLVGLKNTGDDLNEGRLAGAILADQTVHLA